jgi:hypothetical protein
VRGTEYPASLTLFHIALQTVHAFAGSTLTGTCAQFALGVFGALLRFHTHVPEFLSIWNTVMQIITVLEQINTSKGDMYLRTFITYAEMMISGNLIWVIPCQFNKWMCYYCHRILWHIDFQEVYTKGKCHTCYLYKVYMAITLEPLISLLVGHIYLIVDVAQFEYAFHLKLTTKLHHFHKLAKIEHVWCDVSQNC